MILAIVAARVSSSRLPGKVLMDICGKPMLTRVIERVKQSTLIDKIIVATTYLGEDEAIIKLAENNGISWHEGVVNDVLTRYYHCASKHIENPFKDIIVRITGDCPLIDPEIIDKAIKYHLSVNGGYDFVTNTGTYPDGMDTEVFSYIALERAWQLARLDEDREHVTIYMLKHPEMFRIGKLRSDQKYPALKLSVDTREDLERVRIIYKELGENCRLGDIIDFYRKGLYERPN